MADKLTLDIMSRYITGEKKTEPPAVPVELDIEQLAIFKGLIDVDHYAGTFFRNFDNAQVFYDTMPDFAHHISKEQLNEVYYAAKCNNVIKGCPSLCQFMLMQAWKEANGMPNLIMKIIPLQMLKTFFKQNYFGEGLTLEKLVQGLCCDTYLPLSEARPKVEHKTFTELYIKETDMVAAVPKQIAQALSDDDVLAIKVTKQGLETHGVKLRTMCGYLGAINSTYDLRELI